jgi:hypothetical protein
VPEYLARVLLAGTKPEVSDVGREVRMVHFHICWSDSKLDWQAFQTREEAITRAKELVLPDETYVIEELDGACPRCNNPIRFCGEDNAVIGS